ncbi:MAG: glycosyltransferase family 4 protein [Candidatus Acidiferrum sp.]|jgi:glycogen(starch) synthase
MNLLICSHYFAPSVGGVETAVLSLARGLAECDAGKSKTINVTVATDTARKGFDDNALPFRVVRQPGPATLWSLIHRADIIHLAGPTLIPLVFVFLLRKPCVIEHHGYQAICPNGVLIQSPSRSMCPGHFQARRYDKCLRCLAAETSALKALARLIFMFPRNLLSKAADANVAITEHVRRRHDLPNSRVIYYGISDLALTPQAKPVREQNRTVCFAYVGRFVPEKGIDLLLRATALLRDFNLPFKVRLIGDGPLREKLRMVSAEEKITDVVEITGFLTGPDLESALFDVDVVVMPSVWEEAAGLSAIEQMMRGKLVIASSVGGLAEVVADAGMLFATGDAAALALCMRKVLSDPSTINALREKARKRALHLFQFDRMVKEHASLYLEIYAKSKNAK